MATFIETVVGDVLILSTDRDAHLYGVGRVTADGQQDFVEPRQPIYVNDRAAASELAQTMVAPGRRIFIRDFADREWSELVCRTRHRRGGAGASAGDPSAGPDGIS